MSWKEPEGAFTRNIIGGVITVALLIFIGQYIPASAPVKWSFLACTISIFGLGIMKYKVKEYKKAFTIITTGFNTLWLTAIILVWMYQEREITQGRVIGIVSSMLAVFVWVCIFGPHREHYIVKKGWKSTVIWTIIALLLLAGGTAWRVYLGLKR